MRLEINNKLWTVGYMWVSCGTRKRARSVALNLSKKLPKEEFSHFVVTEDGQVVGVAQLNESDVKHPSLAATLAEIRPNSLGIFIVNKTDAWVFASSADGHPLPEGDYVAPVEQARRTFEDQLELATETNAEIFEVDSPEETLEILQELLEGTQSKSVQPVTLRRRYGRMVIMTALLLGATGTSLWMHNQQELEAQRTIEQARRTAQAEWQGCKVAASPSEMKKYFSPLWNVAPTTQEVLRVAQQHSASVEISKKGWLLERWTMELRNRAPMVSILRTRDTGASYLNAPEGYQMLQNDPERAVLKRTHTELSARAPEQIENLPTQDEITLRLNEIARLHAPEDSFRIQWAAPEQKTVQHGGQQITLTAPFVRGTFLFTKVGSLGRDGLYLALAQIPALVVSKIQFDAEKMNWFIKGETYAVL
jgi:hypothetical protein